ncbi:MAG TPA: hypothetical protein VHP38_15055 [Ruminiclostridium sp.]|nr:hypothetical protein [Ruminiclostridium sp.]
MKRTLIIALIFIILTGCSGNHVTSNSEPKSKVKNTYVTLSPSKERFFVNSNEGWKAAYTPKGMFSEEMILYKTKDGGKTWTEIADSKNKESTLPGGDKIGMSFVSLAKGWITVDTPWQGIVGLYMTSDGGVTWSQQKPHVPDEYQNSELHTVPPLFFSALKGVLLSFASEDNKRIPIFYITHDGGESWTPFTNKERGIFDGITCSIKSGTPEDIYEVAYENST